LSDGFQYKDDVIYLKETYVGIVEAGVMKVMVWAMEKNFSDAAVYALLRQAKTGLTEGSLGVGLRELLCLK
jgi:hypothetical protein